MRRTNESSIVAGSGEGIPRRGGNDIEWWHGCVWATICNPILVFHACSIGAWPVAFMLIVIFLVPFIIVGSYKRRHGTDRTLQWLAVFSVLLMNIATLFMASFLPALPLENLAVPGLWELQILLTICYVLFGVIRPLSPDISATDVSTTDGGS